MSIYYTLFLVKYKMYLGFNLNLITVKTNCHKNTI
mgnify:CR=1 FL=1